MVKDKIRVDDFTSKDKENLLEIFVSNS